METTLKQVTELQRNKNVSVFQIKSVDMNKGNIENLIASLAQRINEAFTHNRIVLIKSEQANNGLLVPPEVVGTALGSLVKNNY
ncbi:MAG: hypothetical protein ACOXZ4_01485 [Sphaerochaetaceae bacterium]